MDYAIGLVKPGRDDIEVLGVASIKSPEHGVRDMVGEFHESGGAGVDEHWCIGEVFEDSPLGSNGSKLAAEALEGCLLGAPIQNEQTVLAATES